MAAHSMPNFVQTREKFLFCLGSEAKAVFVRKFVSFEDGRRGDFA
jgi:hypothetical protein